MNLLLTTLRRNRFLFTLLALAGCSLTLRGQEEDEWYDPTDWFDGNNIEADDIHDSEALGEPDRRPFDLDPGYDWNDYNAWGYDIWDDDYYHGPYWDDYAWQENFDEDYVIPDVVYDYDLYYADGEEGETADDLSRLEGTIEGLAEVRLERGSGATGDHRIAKVKLENGQSTVMNLGRSWRTDDLQLAKGDEVVALGRRGTLDGETVFVAEQLRVDGRTLEANPAIRLPNGSGDRPAASSTRGGAKRGDREAAQAEATLSGTIASFNRSTIVGDEHGRAHTFINIRLENGRSSLVDLGPNASLASIDLQSGDHIEVRGRREQRGERQVVVADLLRVNDRRVEAVSERS